MKVGINKILILVFRIEFSFFHNKKKHKTLMQTSFATSFKLPSHYLQLFNVITTIKTKKSKPVPAFSFYLFVTVNKHMINTGFETMQTINT